MHQRSHWFYRLISTVLSLVFVLHLLPANIFAAEGNPEANLTDADGMRTGRTNGTTAYTYTYNGGQLTQMTVNGDAVTFTYDASGNPKTMTWQGNIYYYLVNPQGDVIGITDASGTRLVYYYYTAQGTAYASKNGNTVDLSTTLLQINPLTYRGYVYDRETRYYYLQSRYYNHKVGRFLNADALVSTGQGLLGNNMFAYCLNNPVAFSDEQGTATKSCIDHSTEPRTPWKNSGSGGGRVYKDYRSGVDYGDVADKFYTVRAAKAVGNAFVSVGKFLWDAYERWTSIQQQAGYYNSLALIEGAKIVAEDPLQFLDILITFNASSVSVAKLVMAIGGSSSIGGPVLALVIELFGLIMQIKGIAE